VTRRVTIATIAGDGIGPEVVHAAMPVIQAAAAHSNARVLWKPLPYGADHYLATGETLPDAAFAYLRDEVDAIFVGALGDRRIPDNTHARDILLGLRLKLDLFVNFRPCRLLHPNLCPLKSAPDRAIDFVIFRENTEGIYLGRGRALHVGTPEEEQIAEEVHTAAGVERILTAAFAWAHRHQLSPITLCDKSNVVPAHRLWQRLFERVGAQYPAIEREHRYVDALAMELIRTPERFRVIVTNNMLGDILSDLGAELVGGLGLAPSANFHPGRPGLFEPVHGSAPPLVGRGIANPMAAILSGALMCSNLELDEAATALERGVSAALAARMMTPDLGGTASTDEVALWISEHVQRA
jgi:3-isopropylmalate dehydrogenase